MMERDFLSHVVRQLSRNNQHRHLVGNVDILSLHKELLGRVLNGKQKPKALKTKTKKERAYTHSSLKPFR